MRFSAEIILILFVACNAALSVIASSSEGSEGQKTSNQPRAGNQSAEQMAKQDIDKEKQNAEKQTQGTLDQEAVEAIQETQRAIDAINANRTDEALKHIEQATGKINVLLARNPSTALIPVSAEVRVIDTAPSDIGQIRETAASASWAVDEKNFPAARVLLDQLMSEIRVRTYHLPLATYPAALQDAARLLDQKKTGDASGVLQTALATLVAVDKVTPIPLVVAREAVNQAQARKQQDTNTAKQLLDVAQLELQRGRELGYAGKDQEYTALNQQISSLKKQLGGDTNSTYAKLKERLSEFLNRQSQQQHEPSQNEKTAQAK